MQHLRGTAIAPASSRSSDGTILSEVLRLCSSFTKGMVVCLSNRFLLEAVLYAVTASRCPSSMARTQLNMVRVVLLSGTVG